MKTLSMTAATLGLLLSAGVASAKCTLTVKFVNNDRHQITVLGSESQVKTNGGTWSAMNFGNVQVAPGANGTASWTTNMSCGGGAKRDFRIKFKDSGNDQIYSDTSHTDIDIYDGETLTWKLKND